MNNQKNAETPPNNFGKKTKDWTLFNATLFFITEILMTLFTVLWMAFLFLPTAWLQEPGFLLFLYIITAIMLSYIPHFVGLHALIAVIASVNAVKMLHTPSDARNIYAKVILWGSAISLAITVILLLTFYF